MSKVDDELTRRLRRAERPVDGDDLFEGLERRRSHRERVRRVQAGLLAFAVLAATLGGFAALSRAFREQPERPASPQPSGSPSPAIAGRDIGLGVAMCDLEVLHGIDWDGTGIDGAAWTGAPVDEDGRVRPRPMCSTLSPSIGTATGSAEQASTSTLRSCLLCRPFDTMDLNDDGVLELVVLRGGEQHADVLAVRGQSPWFRARPRRLPDPRRATGHAGDESRPQRADPLHGGR